MMLTLDIFRHGFSKWYTFGFVQTVLGKSKIVRTNSEVLALLEHTWNCDRKLHVWIAYLVRDKTSCASLEQRGHIALLPVCSSAGAVGENVLMFCLFKISLWGEMSAWSWAILGAAVTQRDKIYNTFLIWATFSRSQLRNKWSRTVLSFLHSSWYEVQLKPAVWKFNSDFQLIELSSESS